MPGAPIFHWGQSAVTVAQGETVTVTSEAMFQDFMSYSVGDTSIAIATPNSTWTSWTIQGVSPGTTTVTINGAEIEPGPLTITVTASDDQNFLNERGLTHFWENIDNIKQDKLTAGTNITISANNTISASQPTVNNGTLTIQKNGTTVSTFTANASGNVTANITVPTTVAELSDASAYVTAEDIASTSALTPPVQTNMIANGAVTSGKIADGAVTTEKIANEAVTSDKIDWKTLGYQHASAATDVTVETSNTVLVTLKLTAGTWLLIGTSDFTHANTAIGDAYIGFQNLKVGTGIGDRFYFNETNDGTNFFIETIHGVVTLTSTTDIGFIARKRKGTLIAKRRSFTAIRIG